MGSRRAGPSSTSASGKAANTSKSATQNTHKASTSSENSGFTNEQMALYKAMRSQLAAKKKAAATAKDEGMS
jgi:hypothetical protein